MAIEENPVMKRRLHDEKTELQKEIEAVEHG